MWLLQRENIHRHDFSMLTIKKLIISMKNKMTRVRWKQPPKHVLQNRCSNNFNRMLEKYQ